MTSNTIYTLPEGFRVKDTQSFIQKSRSVHGEKYDYSHVRYTNSTTKVKIVCAVHGEFMMRPASHCTGQGCKMCYYERISNRQFHGTDKFIEKSRKVHGDFYDYSNAVYSGCYEKVKVICPKHGEFLIQACIHYKGHGCMECGREKTRESLVDTEEDFINKANEVHNSFYDYSKVDYKRSSIKVLVTCPVHGDFLIAPNPHLRGGGCAKCANERRKKSKYGLSTPMTLYHVRIFNKETSFEKIGITTKTIETRFDRLHLDGFQYEIIDSIEGTSDKMLSLEDKIMNHLDSQGERYRIRHLKNSRTRGWSECFNEGLIDLNDFIE